MPYELQSEKIVICGETLTVLQASNAMEIDRSMLISEADKKWPENAVDTKDKYNQYVETLLYPSLVACTVGPVPTVQEFMYSIPTADSDKWVETAMRINPLWFTFISDTDEKETEREEKKD